MRAQSLGWEDPPEEGMAIHSSFLPGESHGQRSLVGYIHGVTKHWTWLKRLSTAQHSTIIALLMVKDREAWCAAVQFQFQFSRSVVSDSLRPDEPQHTRPPCPSPTPRVYPKPCPSSRWCHPTISSSVVPFSSCPQSFPASGSLQMSQLFESGGQSTGASASISVLPMNTQDWSPLGCTGWISLQSKGLSRVFSNTTVQKHQFFRVANSQTHDSDWTATMILTL